jgi:hypothetical protein
MEAFQQVLFWATARKRHICLRNILVNRTALYVYVFLKTLELGIKILLEKSPFSDPP